MVAVEHPDVVVIILTIDQREKTLRCLESFRAVRRPAYRILLWDNGSTDGTSDAVGELYPEVALAGAPRNLGVASGRNKAAERAVALFDPPYLLFIDNDMTVSPGFLPALLAPFSDDGDLAQTTGKIACLDEATDDATGSRVIYGAGGCRVRFWLGDTNHVGYGERDVGQYDAAHDCIASGGCMLVRTSIFQELGGFDPLFDPYGPEDLDFGLRARAKGYRALYTPEALVYHDARPGRSYEAGRYSERYAANRARTWLVFMGRHASLLEKLGFYLVGGPYRLLRLVVRELRDGNFEALSGLARGIFSARER
jgi:GT2 family glycosyltransferase